MTTEIPIPSGPTNREIITRAYQVLDISDSMFGLTPEEFENAMLPLGGMMLEWPYDQLGYIFEDAAGMRIEEESGIARKYLDAVAYALAERLPNASKELSGKAKKQAARLYSSLCSQVSTLPDMDLAPGTPVGAGNRGCYPFVITEAE